MLKVVFDTNVIVSALISPKGTTGSLFKFTASYKLILSPLLLKEIIKVLAYPKIAQKYGITLEISEEMLRLLQKRATIIYTEERADLLSDRLDDHILALAKESRCNFLVTGDRRVLAIKRINGTRIISPAEFQRILRKSKQNSNF